MYDKGIDGNYGRTTADTQKAFDAQTTAMMIESTAGLRSRLTAAAGQVRSGHRLPASTRRGYLQDIRHHHRRRLTVDPEGSAQGRAGLRLEHGQVPRFAPTARQSGTSPPATTRSTRPATTIKLDKDWRAKYPQFQTAIDQLHNSPNIRQTQGAFTGVMPQARQTVELAIESVLAGKATVKDALDKAAADVTAAIVDYNKTTAKK